MKTRVPRGVMQTIMAHARATHPEECCGALIGRDTGDGRSVERAVPLENVADAATRHDRYLISPLAIMAVEEDAERAGLAVVGYYHSHPVGQPVPSHIDLERAWPFYTYIIVTPADGQGGEARAWRLSEDETHFVAEELIEVQ